MTNSFNEAITTPQVKSSVPFKEGFKLDPIMSIDGPLMVNLMYSNNGIRLFSGEQLKPPTAWVSQFENKVYGIGVDYLLSGGTDSNY